MEKLKSIIPLNIKRRIEQSNTDDLPSTSSSLHDFFSQSPLFHSMINELTNSKLGFCAKNKEAALELKFNGNACFSSSDYSQASRFYSQAIRIAPVEAVDKDNKLIATLYVNRASSFHKLNLLKESLRDCNRALSVSPRYVKAWYRRGKVNSSLLNTEDAINDLTVALNIEGTPSGKRQIENDLMLITKQKKTDNSFQEFSEKEQLVIDHIEGTPSGKRQIENDLMLITKQKKTDNSFQEFSEKEQLVIDELPPVKLQCVSTPSKGRGMSSLFEIPPASLVHKEEPYAAFLSSADNVPCTSCSIPLYCSERCQHQAGGHIARKFLKKDVTVDILSGELLKYFSEVTSESHLDPDIECFTEHGHECHGVNWPVVLPSQVVLAGRILAKSVKLKENSILLDLAHNYVHLLPESKVENHVYSIVLLYCLCSSYRSELNLCGATFAKVIILISQIKVNSMAVVRMNNAEIYNPLYHSENTSLHGDNMTSNLEQVRVGQAIYLSGSLFNHSCVPNIHAYFISRTLLIRATELVLTGCALEMSYGPQIGQWDYGNRQQFLLDNYSFNCQCSGCTRVNLPDLVLNAFQCTRPNCPGAVLDDSSVEYMKHKLCYLKTPELDSMEHQQKIDNLMNEEIKNIACLEFGVGNYFPEIQSGCCLKCGFANDLKSLCATVGEADLCLRSLKEAVVSNGVYAGLLSNSLCSLNDLKSALHSYNKKLAEAEDILAQAFCSVGEMQQAIEHCTVSIEILKKLYSPGHIAIGNELVKLSSLQLALSDSAATDTVNQMDIIFSNYYGNHAELMFPSIQNLRREVHKLAGGGL